MKEGLFIICLSSNFMHDKAILLATNQSRESNRITGGYCSFAVFVVVLVQKHFTTLHMHYTGERSQICLQKFLLRTPISRMQRLTKIFKHSSIEFRKFGSNAAFLKTIHATLLKGN